MYIHVLMKYTDQRDHYFTALQCQLRECRYYDPSAEKWKKDGCRKTSESNDGWGVHTVTCTCDHTTSFAVVVVMTFSLKEICKPYL